MLLSSLAWTSSSKLPPGERIALTNSAAEFMEAGTATQLREARRRAIWAVRACIAAQTTANAIREPALYSQFDAWQYWNLAVAGFLDSMLDEQAERTFNLLARLPPPRPGDDVGPLATSLATSGPSLEARRGDHTVDTASMYWARVLPLSQDERSLYAFQSIKGALFSASLDNPDATRWKDDEWCQKSLGRIAELRQVHTEYGPDSSSNASKDLETTLLFSTTDRLIPRPDEASGPLADAEREFDKHIFGRAWETNDAPFKSFLDIKEIQHLLGDDTILISYLDMRAIREESEGDWNHHDLFALVLTSKDLEFIHIEDPAGAHIVLGASGENWDRHFRKIMDVRASLRTNNHERATAYLSELSGQIIPTDVLRCLERLGGSRRHLLVHPYQSLHFCPWPLLGIESPLADRWIVTHLPTLGLLKRRNRSSVPKKSGTVAVGLSFEDREPFDLPPLPTAIDETRYVAQLCNGTAYVDSDATKDALLEALRTQRYVHIATHGSHRPASPAFQELYLWPESHSDGILYAYELMGESFDGLELVSLSACETGLSRFDRGDNLRGLVSSLMMSGAETIVGTLWPVKDDATAHFFETLYEELAAGQDRLDAFANAQRDTRDRFSSGSDWAAFQFSGLW